MTTRRQRRGNLLAMRTEKRQAVDQYPARRFHAMEVLKANAIDFARQIDELRCLLVEPAPKDPLSKRLNNR